MATENRNNGLFCNLRVMLVSIFVIFMAIISIAWLVMHPSVPSFRVTSLSVTNFTVSGSKLRGKHEVGLSITNPNKATVEVVLNRCSMLVFYDQVWRVDAVQQHVFLGKMANASVKVDLVVGDSTKKEVVPEELVKDWNKGVVNVNVKLCVKVRFESGIWPSMDKLLNIYCDDLHVGFFTSPKDTGKLLGIGKYCHKLNAGKA
ncbi:uncharacterized protein LOC113859728 [Abrus precatorius]|uniref:Uncharacterized protein LOC113859728 n=1 Tax=Abrus precatorius TaxID=3816 RepID=A0A8B8KWF3_ABRPR|nr:uncharacterized protein LOC113859728 [Abrus precatorius]